MDFWEGLKLLLTGSNDVIHGSEVIGVIVAYIGLALAVAVVIFLLGLLISIFFRDVS